MTDEIFSQKWKRSWVCKTCGSEVESKVKPKSCENCLKRKKTQEDFENAEKVVGAKIIEIQRIPSTCSIPKPDLIQFKTDNGLILSVNWVEKDV